MQEIAIPNIATVVQIAIAPIFLLVAIGSLLNVTTQRLGRVVDRMRVLETGLEAGETGEERRRHVMELKAIGRRIRYANLSTTFCTLAGFLISLVVALIFLGELAGLPVRASVAAIFVLTMICLIIGLGFFLAEVQVALQTMRIRTDLLHRAETNN